jgi:hypothetical protein
MRTNLTLALVVVASGLFASSSSALEVTLFGPQQYQRTATHPNVYSGTFRGIAGTGRVIVLNGDEGGRHRVSSAQIEINGRRLLGPGAFNQQIYRVEAPVGLAPENSISVTLSSSPGSHVTVQVVLDVTPDATSVEVIGIEGGTVGVTNHLGDRMTLTIPPLALANPTPISVAALPVPLPNPVAESVWPGVFLEPAGLQFSLPVRIEVTSHTPLAIPTTAGLYWRIDSTHVLPLANQTVSQNRIEGEIYHFSEVFAGEATEDEITSLAEAIAANTEGTPSALVDDVNALLRFAQYLRVLENPEKAAEVAAAANQLLLEGSTAILSQPVPADACGFYSKALQQLSDLITTLLGDASLANAVRSRGCTFDVAPQLLRLDSGETWPQGLTAILRDPAGNDRSCSALNWYSANIDVVAITSTTGSSAIPTAGTAGIANVSANCDGLIASAEVTVVPPILYRLESGALSEERESGSGSGYCGARVTASAGTAVAWVGASVGADLPSVTETGLAYCRSGWQSVVSYTSPFRFVVPPTNGATEGTSSFSTERGAGAGDSFDFVFASGTVTWDADRVVFAVNRVVVETGITRYLVGVFVFARVR